MSPTHPALDGDLPDIPVNVLAVDPHEEADILYAGADDGVFRSTDGGTTWQRYGLGLPTAAVIDLLLDTGRTRLIAATQGRGAWSITLNRPRPRRVGGRSTTSSP